MRRCFLFSCIGHNWRNELIDSRAVAVPTLERFEVSGLSLSWKYSTLWSNLPILFLTEFPMLSMTLITPVPSLKVRLLLSTNRTITFGDVPSHPHPVWTMRPNSDKASSAISEPQPLFKYVDSWGNITGPFACPTAKDFRVWVDLGFISHLENTQANHRSSDGDCFTSSLQDWMNLSISTYFTLHTGRSFCRSTFFMLTARNWNTDCLIRSTSPSFN